MIRSLNDCKSILCVRLDNMGDILMSVPAITALKESFKCRITLLTSSMGNPITDFISAIDDVIVFDAPWVKRDFDQSATAEVDAVVGKLRSKEFDAAVIFTVCSQNPLPTALMLYQAGIPRRIAYCRENPYNLLTDWVPDPEPYEKLRHQVERDLELVRAVGAKAKSEKISIDDSNYPWPVLQSKLSEIGLDTEIPFLIFHAGVSESKREYPKERWIELGKRLRNLRYQIVITGATSHDALLSEIRDEIGANCIALPGMVSMKEFIALIRHAPVIVSVNTVAVHIAAAVQTPVVVLYAETNPQHTPWKVLHRIFTFPVPAHLKSKNPVLKYITENFSVPNSEPAETEKIVNAVIELSNSSYGRKTLYLNTPFHL
jgi:ADP-heptose:LPS heptosyltransferase